MQERAEKAHEDIEKSNPGESIAKDIDNRKSEAVAAVVEAEANLRLAKQDKQDADQCPALGPEQLQEKEALCLRQDVNDVMRKVEAHKPLWIPMASSNACRMPVHLRLSREQKTRLALELQRAYLPSI